MKKRLTWILILLSILALSGCFNLGETQPNPTQSVTEPFVGELVIVGATDLTYQVGDPLPNYLERVEAFDRFFNSLTDRILVDDHDVDYQQAGTYTVTYSVTDDQGDTVWVQITVTVVMDLVVPKIDHVNIFYLNDTHGNILHSGTQMGLSRIGNLILDEQTKNPDNTLFITGGDMLQGALISNYFKGESTIAALNKMNVDAFVIGNHEFDWGLEEVTKFFDPNYEGLKANFPLLGANVFFKGTTNRPDFIDAYTIVQKAQVKVGIIGLMGYGLERSIAESLVRDYQFADPVYWAEYYARKLRRDDQVDIVLVVIHGANQMDNQAIGSFPSDAKVDAIFNGHTHQATVQLAGTNSVPVIQSGANSQFLGRVRLNLSEQNEVISYSLVNLKASGSISFGVELDARLLSAHSAIDAVLLPYYEVVFSLMNTVITTSKAFYSQDQLTVFISELIRAETGSAIGFHNRGGTRISLSNQQNITIDTIYKLFPFDNTLFTVYLKGSVIEAFKERSDGEHFSQDPSIVFEPDLYYKVAVTSYIYEKSSNPFLSGEDGVDTEVLVRDLIIQEMMERAEMYHVFDIQHPIIVSSVPPTPMWMMDTKKRPIGLFIFA